MNEYLTKALEALREAQQLGNASQYSKIDDLIYAITDIIEAN